MMGANREARCSVTDGRIAALHRRIASIFHEEGSAAERARPRCYPTVMLCQRIEIEKHYNMTSRRHINLGNAAQRLINCTRECRRGLLSTLICANNQIQPICGGERRPWYEYNICHALTIRAAFIHEYQANAQVAHYFDDRHRADRDIACCRILGGVIV